MGFLEALWVVFQFRKMGGHFCFCLSGHSSYWIPHYFFPCEFAEPWQWDFGFGFPWLCNPSAWMGETSVLELLQVTLRAVRSGSDSGSDSSEWTLFCIILEMQFSWSAAAQQIVPQPLWDTWGSAVCALPRQLPLRGTLPDRTWRMGHFLSLEI